MKNLLFVICCASALMLATPLHAQSDTKIVETNTHSVFTGLFRSVWTRLKSLNPSQKESAKSTVVYTAGIRGAESTETLLKPYWKDDLTQDEKFLAELQQFSQAQSKMDRGELEAAVESFDGFLQTYEKSALRPNALFGESISLAGLGQAELSRVTMQQFVDENPRHPLADDAQRVIDELS